MDAFAPFQTIIMLFCCSTGNLIGISKVLVSNIDSKFRYLYAFMYLLYICHTTTYSFHILSSLSFTVMTLPAVT
jgi:hypothetical protein